MIIQENSSNHSSQPENPKVASLLGSVGITALDMQLFDNLREVGFVAFVHGSLMENRVRESSDIDFTVIGDINKMPVEIRDTLMPRLATATAIDYVDYVSTSDASQSGRKISLHISSPEFRSTYATGNPIATEYRPARHEKNGDRSYFLPGIDQQNNIYLINYGCRGKTVGDALGSLTKTPQTGTLTVDGKDVYPTHDSSAPAFEATGIIKVKPNGSVEQGVQASPFELMILGLEFDKMQSDTPVYSQSYRNGDYETYVLNPIERSLQAIGVYSEIDSRAVARRMFVELATYWPKIKPHKTRRSQHQ